MRKLLILTLLVSTLYACQPPGLFDAGEADAIVGAWVYEGWSQTDTATVYVRRNRLVDNQYGYVFTADGRMVQRTNAGWCGTPPITTTDYPGTWQWRHNQLTVQSGNWNGPTTYTYTVVRRQNDKLLLR